MGYELAKKHRFETFEDVKKLIYTIYDIRMAKK